MKPVQSVDAFAGDPAPYDPEPARTQAGYLFTAALIVAALSWLGTCLTAINSSETNGIYASWFAIFPSGFALAGKLSLTQGHRAARSIKNAFLGGVACSLGLWFFFQAIWPSL